jgi:hypothetical protein
MKPFFDRKIGARLCAEHQPQHVRQGGKLRLSLRPQPRSIQKQNAEMLK